MTSLTVIGRRSSSGYYYHHPGRWHYFRAALIAAGSPLRGRGQLALLIAGVIATPRARDHSAAAGSVDADLNCAECAVALVVGRIIADDILRAQVLGDLGGDGGNLADVPREISVPA